jgi:hypothetical protein
MGRESRQARRQRQRRDAERAQKQSSTGSRTGLIAGIVMAVVVIGVVALLFFTQVQAQHSANAHATATVEAEFTPVAGIQYGPIKCTYNEMTQSGFYHVHAHLTILDDGQDVPVDPNVGYELDHDCLTWVHTHNPSRGILHIESPYKIVPTLGEFFDIWNKPLSRTQVASATVKPGESMKVYVDGKLYSGDPASIKLYNHTQITVEIGPPFEKPKPFNFAKYGL